MIEVQVKLFASLRRFRPGLALGQAFACVVAEGTTVDRLTSDVLRLPPKEVAIALVNGLHSSGDRRLGDGDQVALWPPIAGGAGDRDRH